MHKLPVLIVVWNNHWAITTEAQAQWAGDLTAQVRAMDAIAVDVDGVDALAMYETTRQLAQRLRDGEGPAFIHAHMGLLDPHSSSTDIRRYRTREEIDETTRTKDPVKHLGEVLIQRGELRAEDVERIRDEAKAALRPRRGAGADRAGGSGRARLRARRADPWLESAIESWPRSPRN